MSGPTPSIQYSWDGPGALGAPDAGLFMRWNNATGRFEMASVTVPSALDDLSDVTVTGVAQGAVLYRGASGWVHLPAGSSGQALLSGGAGANPAWGAAGVSDHGGLTGLSDDDHGIYALLAPGASARNVIQGAGAGVTSLIVRPHAAQTGGTNIVEFQSAAGAVVCGVGYNAGLWANPYYFGNPWNTSTSISSPTSNVIAMRPGGAEVLRTQSVTPNVLVTAQGAAHVPVAVRGAASQTANLQEWQNSAGTVLVRVNASGDLAVIKTDPSLTLSGTNPALFFGGTGSRIALSSGGTLTIQDGAGQTLATFVHNAGGTLRYGVSSVTRIEWNATGIGFFATTPVAKQAFVADPSGGATVDAEARAAITAVITALENYGLLATS